MPEIVARKVLQLRFPGCRLFGKLTDHAALEHLRDGTGFLPGARPFEEPLGEDDKWAGTISYRSASDRTLAI
jgi:hypothetical protein